SPLQRRLLQGPGRFQRPQVAMVRSRLVLNTAVKQPRVAELPIVKEQGQDVMEWLEKEVRADFSAGPELLTISMDGDNPEELKILVNAITEAYLNEVVYKEHNQRLRRIDDLKEIVRVYQERLRLKRIALRELAEVAGARGALDPQNLALRDPQNLALQQRLAIEQKNDAERELTKMTSEIRRMQVELSGLKGQEKAL